MVIQVLLYTDKSLFSLFYGRGIPRRFKMRGRQGVLEGEADRDSKILMVALHRPLYKKSFHGGLKGGWASDWWGSSPPSPLPINQLTKIDH